MAIDIDKLTDEIYKKIFICDETNAEPLSRPIESSHIFERFKICNKNEEFETIEEFLDSINTDEMGFYSTVEQLIPLTDRLNPHLKVYPVEKYFHKGNGDDHIEHLTKLEDLLKKRGKKEIALIEFSKKRGGIFQIGEKGSGKTISQNYWLYKRHKILEKNKIFWVRLDAGKLIDLWRDSDDLKDKEKIITPKEYLLGQMIYVFCKHFRDFHPDKSELFIEIADKLKNSYNNNIPEGESTKNERLENKSDIANLQEKIKKLKIQGKIIDSTIYEVLSYYEKEIAKTERDFASETSRRGVNEKKDRAKSYLIDNVLKPVKSNGKNKGVLPIWLELAELLRDFISENNYHLLFIIDGIDNINFYFEDKYDYIDKLLTYLFEFPLNKENTRENELLMISIRDTTLERLKKIYSTELYKDSNKYKNINNFFKINQDSKNLYKSILCKRVIYVHRHKDTKEYKDCFMSKVLNVIKDHNIVQDEKRWGGNFRCFLFNHLTLAKLITFRYYYFNQPKDFDIKKQMETFENINFLINGSLYIDNINNRPSTNKGDNIINIFGQEKNPFIYTRILQIIQKEKPYHNDLFFMLKSKFKYNNEKLIENCIDKMISTVMIKSTYSEKLAKSKYEITPKGNYILNQFYNDIHFLYFSCLDTPVPNKVLSEIKVAHYNNRSEKRAYPPFSIITAINFLRYINYVHNEEMKNISDDEQSKYLLPINEKTLKHSIREMVNLCTKDEDFFNLLMSFIKETK